jgi:lipopolysaccharide biosynthesis glycosyltransferase
MLHSALARCSSPIEVDFLHPPDLSDLTLARIGSVVGQGGGTFRPVAIADDAVASLPRTGQFPPIIWYRTLLPELRPDVSRVLYLDSDTLVVDDLLPLWSTDVSDHYVAAVQNLIEPRLATLPHAVGIPSDQVYFNSGVLLMNLDAMRRDDCTRRIHAHATAYRGRSIWPDQDSLNHVLGVRCALQHPRWNCQNSFFCWDHAAQDLGHAALADAIGAPAILHFEGPSTAKPWHHLSRHPWRSTYWEHLRATPFGSTRAEGRTLRNRAIRRLPSGAEAQLRGLKRRWRSRAQTG